MAKNITLFSKLRLSKWKGKTRPKCQIICPLTNSDNFQLTDNGYGGQISRLFNILWIALALITLCTNAVIFAVPMQRTNVNQMLEKA